MPDQLANRPTLRLDNHRVEVYAAFFLGASVVTGTVVSATSTNITYTLTTGASANVRRGFRLVIKTSGGLYKHATTVRASGTISDTNMPFRESSDGTVDIVAGDLIEVRSIPQPGDKLVTADNFFNPDGLAVGTNNSAIPPVCCSGNPWAGPLDDGQSYATVPRTGSTSYTLDEDSGGDITHLWTLPAGVTFAPGSAATDDDPVLRAIEGEHLVIHTVTDDDNGASWTQFVPIKVGGAYEVGLDSMPASDLQNGASCTLELFQNGTLTDIPDGTLTIVYMIYTINGVRVNFGSAVDGAHHILVAGYTNGDTFAYSDGLDTLTVDIVSPLTWYAETLGLSKVGLRDSSPANWGEIEELRVWMMCIQILRWYTWLTETWDVLMHEYLEDEGFAALFLQEMDAIAQVRELVEGLAGRFVCQLNGRFEGQPRPELMPTNHRGNIDSTFVTGDPDILEYRFNRLHRRPVKIVRTRAITSSGKARFAKWPGAAPGGGTVTEVIEKLVVFSGADNFELAGKFGAYHDRIFVDTDGSVHHAPEGELTLPYFAIADPALCEWWEFDPAMQTNLRGVTLSTFRWVLQAARYELGDSGEPTTILTIRAETDTAADGVDDTPPAESETGVGDIDWTPPSIDLGLPTITPPPPPGTGIVFGKDRMALIASDGHIYVTFNFDYASPTYTNHNMSASFVGTLLEWCYDANPANRDTEGWVIDGEAGADDGAIYKLTTIFGSPITVTQQPNTLVAAQYRNIEFSFGVGGAGLFGIVTSNETSTQTFTVSETGDGGDNWSAETTLGVSGYQPFTTPEQPAAHINSRNGKAYATGRSDGIVNVGGYDLYERDFTTGAWTQRTGLRDDDSAHALTLTAFADTASTYIYYGDMDVDVAPAQRHLYRAPLPNGPAVDISPTATGVPYGPDPARGKASLSISPTNKNRAVLCGINGAGTARGVWVTSDLEAVTPTWTAIVAPSGSVKYTRCALIDDNRLLLFGLDGVVGYSADFGANIVSKAGGIVTSAEFIGATG